MSVARTVTDAHGKVLYDETFPSRYIPRWRRHLLQLLWAERNRDVRACDLAIERIARWIVAGRAAPFQASGWPGPIDPWDWLEIGFEVQARIAEEPVPTHTLMLERAGLLGPGPSRRVARPQPGGIDRIPVTGADGARIEVVFDRRDSELIHIALDPRDEPPYEFYLVLSFYWDRARLPDPPLHRADDEPPRHPSVRGA